MYSLRITFIIATLSFSAFSQSASDPVLYPVNDPQTNTTTYIDARGFIRLTVPYSTGPFHDGVARFYVNGKTGYIDRTGKVVIQPQAISSLDFSHGLALFYAGKPCQMADDPSYYGFIGKDGQVAIQPTLSHPCNYNYSQFNFTQEGLALTHVGKRWGFIDKTGKVVMQFDDARQFSEGLAAVNVGGKFGFVDTRGRVVIKPQFDSALPFSEGFAVVEKSHGWGFTDKKGRMVVAPRFEEARSFSDGMAAVKIGGKWGYIERNGRLVIAPTDEYQSGGPFLNGRSQISVGFEVGYIDKSGKIVIETEYRASEEFVNELARVTNNEDGRTRYIDVNGKTVYEFPQPKPPPPDLNNPFVRISLSNDVAWLEKIAASPESATQLGPGGGLAGHARDLSTGAYARLGTLGTPESLAAIRRIEESARTIQNLTPEFVPLGVTAHPAWHFSDSELRPIAQVARPDGITYGIVYGDWMGDLDLFLISNKTPKDPATWTRPKLIPDRFYRGLRDPKLTIGGENELVLSFTQDPPPARALMEGTHDPGPQAPRLGAQEVKISLEEIECDSDKDGWTDIEEARLGLNPNNPDSDGDGLPDGRDVCPNLSDTQMDPQDEDLKILQRAVFATFGLTRSRSLLLVGANSRRLTIWGYRGPVIYGEDVKSWSKKHQYGGIFVNWKIRKRSESQVIVEIVDYEGPLAASGQDVRFRKIGNEWVVVSRRTTWVS